MKIACLSGKGGAGKTLTAVNLAAVAAYMSFPAGAGSPAEETQSIETETKEPAPPVVYIDCDVEEPNGHLFLKPEDIRESVVATMLPEFDPETCTGCRKCVDFCHFHALIQIRRTPIVFSEVCHSCGGCSLVCPEGAVREVPKTVGTLQTGRCGAIRVVTGNLQPGEPSGIPVIREALKQAEGVTIIDCPPGSACSVMESASDADYCILVAEPTAFGFHNFRMVHELVTLLGRTCGVIINKQDEPYEPLEAFCRENNVPVLARIPYDPELAALIAEGKVVSRERPEMRRLFTDILTGIGLNANSSAAESAERNGGAA